MSVVADRVVVAREGAEIGVHGSFRVPRRAARMTSQEHRDALADQGPLPTAIVPISLVLTGTANAGPILFELRVPSYDPPDQVTNTGEVTGCFSLNLNALGRLTADPQTYFLYVFTHEHMVGPTAIGVVDERRIAG